jgi:hypothetical protein
LSFVPLAVEAIYSMLLIDNVVDVSLAHPSNSHVSHGAQATWTKAEDGTAQLSGNSSRAKPSQTQVKRKPAEPLGNKN